ncbi:hypothetical protein C7M84_022549 [Penaeus vannamei]|uniref:Uncharacterized protein n=1 Tax=Penaeus vannamei TaxID=6689 RepID=A0A423U6H3_PENVA|nr:hypothetical protein C7M84_022549 [Penaeus vannamei]
MIPTLSPLGLSIYFIHLSLFIASFHSVRGLIPSNYSPVFHSLCSLISLSLSSCVRRLSFNISSLSSLLFMVVRLFFLGASLLQSSLCVLSLSLYPLLVRASSLSLSLSELSSVSLCASLRLRVHILLSLCSDALNSLCHLQYISPLPLCSSLRVGHSLSLLVSLARYRFSLAHSYFQLLPFFSHSGLKRVLPCFPLPLAPICHFLSYHIGESLFSLRLFQLSPPSASLSLLPLFFTFPPTFLHPVPFPRFSRFSSPVCSPLRRFPFPSPLPRPLPSLPPPLPPLPPLIPSLSSPTFPFHFLSSLSSILLSLFPSLALHSSPRLRCPFLPRISSPSFSRVRTASHSVPPLVPSSLFTAPLLKTHVLSLLHLLLLCVYSARVG